MRAHPPGRRPLAIALAVLVPVLLLVPLSMRCHAMAATPEPVHLTWQWNRAPQHAVLVKVSGVKAEGGGWFGIRRSPSLADALPDAQLLSGTVVAGDALAAGTPLVLRAPKHELPAVAPGALVAIGYTDDKAAVRITPAPEGLAGEAAATWLEHWLATPG